MLHIEIICVGKLKEDYLKSAIAEYIKRLSKYCSCQVIELPDEKLPSPLYEADKKKVIQKESNCILSHIKENSYVIALDLTGKEYSSEEFSEKLSNIALRENSTITFLIGGTLGMTKELLDCSKELVCFSKMTFPHPLIRVFLLEQLFRSFKIANGENYHD